jgi:hypothetical protein
MKGIATMNASERGLKHLCADCGCKYYDLGKTAAACPKCGGQPAPVKLVRSGRPVKKSSRSTFGQYP